MVAARKKNRCGMWFYQLLQDMANLYQRYSISGIAFNFFFGHSRMAVLQKICLGCQIQTVFKQKAGNRNRKGTTEWRRKKKKKWEWM